MGILKYIERLKRMDDLIRRNATGTSNDFAKKLGISRSVLMDNIRDLRELGANVGYSHFKKSYFYEKEFKLIIGTVKKDASAVWGGRNVAELESDIIVLGGSIFNVR